MKSMSITCPSAQSQRGFSIVAGIFILVVLASLAGFIVSVSSTQNISFAQDSQGARAYQAARAGIESGIQRWLPATGTGTCSGGALTFSDADLSAFTTVVAATQHAATMATGSGSAAATTLSIASITDITDTTTTASKIVPGLRVRGTGIAAGATVVSFADPIVTLSAANTGAVSGTVYFGSVFCRIVSTASPTGSSAGSLGFVERQLQAVVEQAD